GGDDGVNVFDLSSTTTIDLGDGDDKVSIDTTSSGTLVVTAGSGEDALELLDVGLGTNTSLFGEDDIDSFFIQGNNLESSNNTLIDGGSPSGVNEGDFFLFDPAGQTVTNTNPLPADGTQGVVGLGSVNYVDIEVLQTVGAPVITFDDAELTIWEGDSLDLSIQVDFAGNPQLGDIEWDLDNDGIFGEPEEVSGLTQLISWEDLLITSDIDDDGSYTIAVKATNSVGTTTLFRTLTVNNTQPTIETPQQVHANVGEPFSIDLAATDPGDDRITRWEIRWGDGTDPVFFGASAVSATHTYTRDGSFDVRIFAYDEDSEPLPAAGLFPTVRASITTIPHAGPFELSEGDDLVLEATPYGNPVSIGWDLNNNSTIDFASASGTLTWDQLQSLVPTGIDDSGDYTIGLVANYLDVFGRTVGVATDVDLKINNVAPTAVFANSGPVTEGSDGSSVAVSFSNPFDPSAADTAAGFTYDFFFGDDPSFDLLDFSTSSVSVPAALLAEDGTLDVRGIIRDQDGGSTEYVTTIHIHEDEPDIHLAAEPTSVSEGVELELTALVVDRGNEVLEQIIVDWGDGVVETVDDLDQPIGHLYADNGSPTIELSLWSDGIKYTQTLGVSVTNSAPGINGLAPQAGTIFEGDLVRLTGLIDDLGTDDSFEIDVDWGDGVSETYQVAAGSTSFDVTHTYANEGSYTVTATIRDDDQGVSEPVTTVISIANANPEVRLTPNRSSLLEGDEVTLDGIIQDAGLNDTFDVTIDWGDGSVPTVILGVGSDFQAAHSYLDDVPTQTSADELNIVVTVVDTVDAGSTGTAEQTVEVVNVAPQLSELDGVDPRLPLDPVGLGELVVITGLFTEQGVADDVSVEVDWGDGQVTGGTLTYTSALGGQLEVNHSYDTPGDHEITVRLLDDDGGVSNELTTTVSVVDLSPPQVANIIIGDGSAQRSVIRSITVEFDSLVTIDAGAFVLTDEDGNPVDVNVENLVVDGKTQAVLTFSGSHVDSSGSLIDGNYILTVVDTSIYAPTGTVLDGDQDGEAGGHMVDEFFRFFGDGDGDRDVDVSDLAQFLHTYRKSSADDEFSAVFDFDNDGDVDVGDLSVFLQNYRSSLP
ncbi:MAG: PKD domain-containing protein, partial [Pirellulales bacterium]|nr:PKD domain-containing protein [Pirellulales bacterium]